MTSQINIDYPILDLAALLVLVPFMAFGVYSLRRRFLYHDDWGLACQSVALLYALLTAAFEVQAIRDELVEVPVYLIFASLGMLAATMALYGHMAVSFLSKIMVDMFLPGGDQAASQPRFGPAEALERLGDYRGALDEYYVLARIFPRRPEIMARIGATLDTLHSHEEAAQWFRRALESQEHPQEAAALLWQLLDVLENRLQRPDLASNACEEFLFRFPQAAETEAVRLRLNRMVETRQTPPPTIPAPARAGLVRLAEEPITPRRPTE